MLFQSLDVKHHLHDKHCFKHHFNLAHSLSGSNSIIDSHGVNLTPWVGGGIKIGEGHNKNLGGTISKCYKSGGAPMVKIKDFTLASKNRGVGTCPPCPTHLQPMIDTHY